MSKFLPLLAQKCVLITDIKIISAELLGPESQAQSQINTTSPP